jgi:hypothetical protein
MPGPIRHGVLAVLVLWTGEARAQRAGLEVLASAEFWETDAGSRLLAMNGGTPMLSGSLYGFGVVRPHQALEFFALGALEAAPALDQYDATIEQLTLRVQLHPAFGVEGGRLLLPVGGFVARRFPHLNPLIGAPDTYPALYPWGAQVTGVAGPIDYRVAVVDLPTLNERYLPEAGRRLRPAAAAGLRTGPDVRLGVSATHGPYLGREVGPALPPGSSRDDFKQTILGAEARYSRGHVEARGELLWSRYDVPTLADPVDGLGWYLELRATVTPRLFVAGRFERNRYPFVLPVNQTTWVGTDRTVQDAEIGVGYRLSRDGLLKLSYRRDDWPDPDPPGVSFPNGHALAVQASWFFDVGALLTNRLY